MATITVESVGAGYEIKVSDGASTTTHRVTVERALADRVAPGAPVEEFVAASFRFLLDREPKESILGSFDLSVISRYFPEYESKVGDYLLRG